MKHNTNKNDDSKIDVTLDHGSMLVMKGSTQHFWKHCIPKTKKIIKPRLNLTFRNVSV